MLCELSAHSVHELLQKLSPLGLGCLIEVLHHQDFTEFDVVGICVVNELVALGSNLQILDGIVTKAFP